jgi:hypothetical protein
MATSPRRDLQERFAKWTEAERLEFVRESDSNSKRFWDEVRSSPISPYLSRWERSFATTTELTMSNQQQLDGSWRLEAVQILLWALRLITELPEPDTQADLYLSKFDALNDPPSFLNSAILRPQTEIYRARDVAELWHWRSRTEKHIREGQPFPSNEAMIRQGLRSYQDIVHRAANAAQERGDVHLVIGGDFGVKGKSYAHLSAEEWSEVRSITIERHYALNWLCGYSPHNDWDQTPTDT